MRIAILTLPPIANYGNILQAYALKTLLERKGHQVTLLCRHYDKKEPSWYVYVGRIVRKYIQNQSLHIFQEKDSNRYNVIHNSKIRPFIENYLSPRFLCQLSDIQEKDYEGIVVGSDQVWRKLYFETDWQTGIENAYLSFAEKWNIRRVAYAVSFGKSEWDYSVTDTERCKSLAGLFDSISVREDVGAVLCKKYLNVTAHQVLDPTMLLGVEDYLSLIRNKMSVESPREIVTYILDSTNYKSNVVETISNKRGWSVFHIIQTDDGIKIPIALAVEEWLACFWNAKFVITDSFHACAFSLIFNKPFVVISNNQRGLSRINSLLSLTKMEDRLIEENQAVEITEALYRVPNVDLQSIRQLSLDLLYTSLENE